MTDAKLISYTINDFSTEIEMESFLHLMEKHGDEFYKKLKKHGLVRWRVNQIWNKAGGFALSSIFEYKDQKAFEKSKSLDPPQQKIKPPPPINTLESSSEASHVYKRQPQSTRL